MKHVDHMMREAVEQQVFPGGVLWVARENQVIFFEAYGYADIFSGSSMTRDTVFDLASLTKPLATTLLLMQLVQKSILNLDQHITSILPCFSDPLMPQVTIRHLLAHCSGLPAYRPYYLELMKVSGLERKKNLRKLLSQEMLIYTPGSQGLYSDLGFMVLCWILETVMGERLDRLIAEYVYGPLGLDRLFFIDLMLRERDSSHYDMAATEFCPWRNKLLKGEVHDDNAYIVGGIDGHAGLFGTAGDVGKLLLILVSDYAEKTDRFLFDSAVLKTFWSKQGSSGRALGFDMPSPVNSSCGRYFPETSIGHLGYTGGSFWIDIEDSVIVILLTNRVHPSRYNILIRQFRPAVHNAIMKFCTG